jgi:hypothetical protein
MPKGGRDRDGTVANQERGRADIRNLTGLRPFAPDGEMLEDDKAPEHGPSGRGAVQAIRRGILTKPLDITVDSGAHPCRLCKRRQRPEGQQQK